MTKSGEPKTAGKKSMDEHIAEEFKAESPPRLALVARHDDGGKISIGIERWDSDSFTLSPVVSEHKSKGGIDSEIRMILGAIKDPPLPYFVFDSDGSYDRFLEAVTLLRLAKSLHSLQGRFDRIAEDYGAPATREDCVKRLLSRVAVASADPEKSEDKKADRLLVRVEAGGTDNGAHK